MQRANSKRISGREELRPEIRLLCAGRARPDGDPLRRGAILILFGLGWNDKNNSVLASVPIHLPRTTFRASHFSFSLSPLNACQYQHLGSQGKQPSLLYHRKMLMLAFLLRFKVNYLEKMRNYPKIDLFSRRPWQPGAKTKPSMAHYNYHI